VAEVEARTGSGRMGSFVAVGTGIILDISIFFVF
jgi:hypothetical protein